MKLYEFKFTQKQKKQCFMDSLLNRKESIHISENKVQYPRMLEDNPHSKNVFHFNGSVIFHQPKRLPGKMLTPRGVGACGRRKSKCGLNGNRQYSFVKKRNQMSVWKGNKNTIIKNKTCIMIYHWPR